VNAEVNIAGRAASDAVWNRRLWLIVSASTVVRLMVAAATGLGVDESYAVTVARPLSWSYFDHPPLHFWMAGGMTWLTGDTRALAVRLPFVLAFSVTLWAIGRLGQHAFGARAGALGALSLVCTGVLGLTTGTWVLPDGPLVMCASLAALMLAPLLFNTANPTRDPATTNSWLRWGVVGVLLGGALLSKYHAVLYGAGILLFLLTTESGRRQLRTSGPWLAAAIALLCTVPVLWWNAEHGWVSFTFQGARAATTAAWSIAPFVENVVGQALWLLPWMAVPFAVALGRAIASGRTDVRQWFFACLALVPVCVFTVITLGGARGLPHWQAPGWLFAAPLVGRMLDRAITRDVRWPRWWLPMAAGTWLTLVLILGSHVATGWLSPHIAVLSAPADPTLDAFDWRALRDSLSVRGIDIRDGVTTRSWIQAGKLGVALGATTPIMCACDDAHHLLFRYPATVFPRLVVEHVQPWKRGWQPASVALTGQLGPLDSLGTITLARSGQPAVSLAVYRLALPETQAQAASGSRSFRR